MIVFFSALAHSLLIVSLETTMDGNKMAKFLLLLIAVDLLLFSSTEAWRRRRRSRRRRRCSSSKPEGVAWVNQWQQPFSFSCKTSKPVAKHIYLYRITKR